MYIRTKDGIYEIEDEIIITPYLDEGWEKVFKIVDSNKCIKEQDVIAQSDNLAKLCDVFVLVDDVDNSHKLDRNLKELTMYKTFIAGSRGTIYGAIWTDKGLIYVAKMDSEGKLVLI